MSVRPVQRPVRFSPSEVSTWVNQDVVAQHAEEAVFLWTLRRRTATAPHCSLKDLAIVDERVEAHLDGLRAAGAAGWRRCCATLADGGPGAVFSLAVLAFGSGDRGRMRDAVNAGCASPELSSGLISALGWLDYENVSPALQMLVNARSPVHRRVGIAAFAVHRRHPGSALRVSIEDPDSSLRARALRAVGELRVSALGDHLEARLKDDDDEECQFWAAWALSLLGRREGTDALLDFAERGSMFAEDALQVGLRAMPFPDSRRWLRAFAARDGHARLTVIGAGTIGDPIAIPWLISKMESPAVGRLAGEAFTAITGVDLAHHDLDGESPPAAEAPEGLEDDDGVFVAREADLPSPAAPLVAQWWEHNQSGFSAGRRYLGGQPITEGWLRSVLTNGTQRHRACAALELALNGSIPVLWEVRARGGEQLERLLA